MEIRLDKFKGISFGDSSNALEISNFVKSCADSGIVVIDTSFPNGYVGSFHIVGHEDVKFKFNSTSMSQLEVYAVIHDGDTTKEFRLSTINIGISSSASYLSCILWNKYSVLAISTDNSSGGRNRLFSKDSYNAKYLNFSSCYYIKNCLYSYSTDELMSTIYGYFSSNDAYGGSTGYIVDNVTEKSASYSTREYYPLVLTNDSYAESMAYRKVKNIVPLMCNAGYFKDYISVLGSETNYAGIMTAVINAEEVTLKYIRAMGYIALM